MITVETLRQANEKLKTIPIKGKNYATVNERVKAFREIEPEGSIKVEWLVIDLLKGFASCKASVYDSNGTHLADGTAYEREDSSFINKTSFIENCETSAVGRALGFLGVGIDESICTANELNNALVAQDNLASDEDKEKFKDLCKNKGVNPTEILREIGWKSGPMTKDQFTKAMNKLK